MCVFLETWWFSACTGTSSSSAAACIPCSRRFHRWRWWRCTSLSLSRSKSLQSPPTMVSRKNFSLFSTTLDALIAATFSIFLPGGSETLRLLTFPSAWEIKGGVPGIFHAASFHCRRWNWGNKDFKIYHVLFPVVFHVRAMTFFLILYVRGLSAESLSSLSVKFQNHSYSSPKTLKCVFRIPLLKHLECRDTRLHVLLQ